MHLHCRRSGNGNNSEQFLFVGRVVLCIQRFRILCTLTLVQTITKTPQYTLQAPTYLLNHFFFLYRREDFIALAILRLVEEEKAVVEGAGVTAFAAVLAGMLPELQDKK